MTNRELISVARKNILEIGKIADSAMEGLLAENESLQNQLIQRNDELLKLREQVPRWISAAERMPEENSTVLVYRPGMVRTILLVHYGKRWENGDVKSTEAGFKNGAISHWMPLPEPPENLEAKENE